MPRGGWNKGKTKSGDKAELLLASLSEREMSRPEAMRLTGLSDSAFDSFLATLTATTMIYEDKRGGKTVYGLLKT